MTTTTTTATTYSTEDTSTERLFYGICLIQTGDNGLIPPVITVRHLFPVYTCDSKILQT